MTETSYNFKGILIKFRVVSHDLLSTDKRQFLSYFCSNLKMTDEKKHQNVLDKLRCLDEFKKPEHRRKSNAQLGIVAADLLGKVKPFDKSTIMRWRNNEKKFRDQAMGVFVNQSQPELESTETESTGLTQQMENTTVGEKRRQKQTSMTDFMKKIKNDFFF